MKHKAVLEIGTEEIPAKLISRIHKELMTTAGELLQNNRIKTEEIEVLGAPRRLTLILDGVYEYQDDIVEEIKGPPSNIAFDDQGKPTKAATGFASSQGLEVDELEERDTDRGKYLFAVIEREGKPVVDLLGEVFTGIIKNLRFPISMRWGDYDLEFIRPIHWILALYDDSLIEFELDGIESVQTSRGHRFLAGKEVFIDDAGSYLDQLRENFVIVDPAERSDLIIEGMKELEEEIGGKVEIDESLLEEVVHLVEYPTAFYGSFSTKYLEMPEPVLVTPIKEHQRYFVVRDQEGKLLPRFIGVRDGAEDNIEIVRAGNEKVLKARLDDAEFYYEIDLESTMDERVEQLRDLVFVEELGTMYDKVQRIRELACYLGEMLDLTEDELKLTDRAAALAKADLISQMVREFSELQGVIGEEYAYLEGEDTAVCSAISEHYRPRFAGDDLPETIQGKLVAIADKIDTLVGSFGIGMIPTGSEDPYGLRRSAVGLVRILWESNLYLSLPELLQETIRVYDDNDNKLTRKNEEIVTDVLDFLRERIEYLLSEQGVKHDVIQAVVAGIPVTIPDIFLKADIYEKIREEEEFKELAVAYTRVKNIAGDREAGDIKPDLFAEETEGTLYNVYQQVNNKVMKLKNEHKYMNIYNELKKLITPVHDFFESVMVMAEDNDVKNNRLNLVADVYTVMSSIGDLEKIE